MTTATTDRPKTPAAIRRSLPGIPTRKLPADVDTAPEQIATPATEYGELRERAIAAIETVVELEGKRPEAAAADREADAAAVRDGKPTGKGKAATSLDSKIESARREATALVDATALAWAEFAAALTEHGTTWRKQLDARRAEAAQSGAKALQQAEGAIEETATTRALLDWLEKAEGSLSGEWVGATARRFPGTPTISAVVNIGGVTYRPDQLFAPVRSWLEATA